MKLVGVSGLVYIRRMQTALHILALVRQLREDLVGGTIVATEFYRKQRAAYFFVKEGRGKSALGFVFHPAGSGVFCVPASKVNLDTREKPWPILGLDGAEIVSVEQLGLDRLFKLAVVRAGESQQVVFEAVGPNGNIWLLDESGGRQATLRNRQFEIEELYRPTPIGDRLDPSAISPDQLAERLEAERGRSPLATLKSSLVGLNETMVREALRRAEVTVADLDEPGTAVIEKLAGAIRQIAGWFEEDRSGYLYEIHGAVEVYPFKLTSKDVQPEKMKSLSFAVMEMVGRRKSAGSEADEEKTVMKAVTRAVKKQTRLIANVEADLKQAADYPRYKLYAELLQINRERLKRGMKQIEVEDVISGSGDKITIALDSALSPNEIIDAYFKKHRKGREGLELLERRLHIATEELESLTAMQDELETNYEAARPKYEAELAALGPRSPERSQTAPRLPYRPATLSTGLTVFIGRDGADNDRTTFDFARPYELWFHTSQCPGSHVVMKYPNKVFQPSRSEIEETAAIAAYHSKARNDSLVSVIYTERRYVRKPRKAKPGLVTVEREKSVMVTPQRETTGR